MRQKGFTLVEIMVGAGILSLLVGTAIGLFVFFGRSTGKESKDQEYWQKFMILDAHLKQDLRSAREVLRIAPRVYRIKSKRLVDLSRVEDGEIWYLVDPSGLGVERVIKFKDGRQKSTVFDFGKVMKEGEVFKFELET